MAAKSGGKGKGAEKSAGKGKPANVSGRDWGQSHKVPEPPDVPPARDQPNPSGPKPPVQDVRPNS